MQKIFKSSLVFLFLLTAIACQPEKAIIPPTPQVIKVQYTIALQGWSKKLNSCAKLVAGIGLVTDEISASQLEPQKVDFALRFGPSDLDNGGNFGPGETSTDQANTLTSLPTYFSVVIADDEIVLVANSAHNSIKLTPDVITEIYSGQITSWSDLIETKNTPQTTETDSTIQVWSYPTGDDLRQVFDKVFLQEKAITDKVYLAPDQSAMIEALSENSNAIGFLLKSEVPDTLQVIAIDGTTSYSLEQPILALSQNEPQDQVRQIILCLQSK